MSPKWSLLVCPFTQNLDTFSMTGAPILGGADTIEHLLREKQTSWVERKASQKLVQPLPPPVPSSFHFSLLLSPSFFLSSFSDPLNLPVTHVLMSYLRKSEPIQLLPFQKEEVRADTHGGKCHMKMKAEVRALLLSRKERLVTEHKRPRVQSQEELELQSGGFLLFKSSSR